MLACKKVNLNCWTHNETIPSREIQLTVNNLNFGGDFDKIDQFV